jgi:hypothetical protein
LQECNLSIDEISEKVYQSAAAFYPRGGRHIAHSDTGKERKHHYHIYDDATIENMVRYYKVEENFDSLLRYIKSRSVREHVP